MVPVSGVLFGAVYVSSITDHDKFDMQGPMWGIRSERMADRIRKAKNVS
jgi:hypothetical protein